MSTPPTHRRTLASVRYRCLVRLSSVADDAAPLRRTVLVVAIVAATVLGLWGRAIYIDQNPEVEHGISEVVYGTLGMFTNGAELVPVPWQLDVARVLAPLAAFGLLVEVGLAAFAGLLRRRTARRAVDHLVVVGPDDHAVPYLEADLDLPGLEATAIHMSPKEAPSARESVRIVGPEPTRWLRDANISRARRVVLATGSDRLDLELLAELLASGDLAQGCEVVVEVDDPDLAGRLTVDIAGTHPEQALEVVSPDGARATHATRAVAARVAEGRGLCGDGHEAHRPSAALIGDGRTARLMVGPMVRALDTLAAQEAKTRPVLYVIDPDPAGAQRAESRTSHRVELRVGTDVRSILRQQDPPQTVMVDLSDTDESARLAVEIASRHRSSTVFFAGEHPLAGSGDLRHLSVRAAARSGELIGPLTALVAARHPRPTPPPPPDTAPSTPTRSRAERTEERRTARERCAEFREELLAWRNLVDPELATLRRAVAALAERGWLIVADGDPAALERSRPPSYFDAETKAALGPILGTKDPSHLIHELKGVGFVVLDPAPTQPAEP